jgi:osmotically-inducible protein OsmY
VKKQPIEPTVVRSAIEKALERRADREAQHISVMVDQNTVTLIGRVHSWTEKEAVVGAARQAMGIADVVDHLHIDPYF